MVKLIRKFLVHLGIIKCVPSHLISRGRGEDQSFDSDCKLYRGFEPSDLDPESGQIKTENIKFPDLSCNWDRYSSPEDVRYRNEGCGSDGCYSVTTDVVRHDKVATPVHDPITTPPWYNYAHVEVRCLRQGEDFAIVPPKKRKLPNSKARKLAYRKNFSLNAQIELDPLPQ